MSAAGTLVLLWALVAAGQPPAEVADAPPEQAVRSSLGAKDYPWYDAERDAVRPIMNEPGSWSRRLGRWIDSLLDRLGRLLRSSGGNTGGGNASGGGFFMLLMLAGGALFVVLLWRLWWLHDVGLGSGGGEADIGDAARIAGLRPGMSLEGVDPWAEAMRRRVDDPAGAIVWLFLDQLMSLQRLGLIRLTPGKTARQYAQALEDPVLADSLNATLGAFEAVYYGHRLPTAASLSAVWSGAERFRARLDAIREEQKR